MPTYEYACTACAEHIEVVQSFTDASLTECPSCGGRLRKVFSPVGVVFKGSGFYKTDSRSSSSPAKKSESSKSDSGGSSETKQSTGSTSPAKSDSSKSESTAPAAKPAATGTTG